MIRLTRIRWVVLAGLLVAGTCTHAQDRTWRAIFDGTSVEGWEQVGRGRFVLSDGVLRAEGGMGLLWYTREKFGDCTIRVVYRTSEARANSGVFIRIAEPPADAWAAVHRGYEVQICDAADRLHRTGAIYSLSGAEEAPVKVGEWNTLEIALRGELVAVTVNGKVVNQYDPATPPPPRLKFYEPKRGPRPAAGYIGLQNHGEGDVVEFREVSVRPLGQ